MNCSTDNSVIEATCKSAPDNVSVSAMPTAYIPAALIPSIPAWASSKPIASFGSTLILSAAFTKISGSGFPFLVFLDQRYDQRNQVHLIFLKSLARS